MQTTRRKTTINPIPTTPIKSAQKTKPPQKRPMPTPKTTVPNGEGRAAPRTEIECD
jgi:hypothetical protein